MKIEADLHTHTLSCGHAFSSLAEMAAGAKLNGLTLLATTDHGPNLPGAASLGYFRGITHLPEVISGIRVLKGVEANIKGYAGELDVPDEILSQLDLVLVGFHTYCGYEGSSIEENTRAMIGAMSNPLVDVVVHPGNPQFQIDVERVVRAAMEYDVLIEINNASFCGSRLGSKENCRLIAAECLKQGALVTVDSDAHISFDVGKLEYGLQLVTELGFKPEQVLNTSATRVLEFVQQKKKMKKFN